MIEYLLGKTIHTKFGERNEAYRTATKLRMPFEAFREVIIFSHEKKISWKL
jgi:hypothetical protein